VTTTTAQELEVAVLARLLSLGVSPPRSETLDEMRSLAAGLADRGGQPPELGELAAALETGSLEHLEAEFERLFGGDPVCPPYEGSYQADPFRQARELADVNGFYLAFGASPAGPAAERGDHVGCELEFLSFLALKQLAAGLERTSEDAETCRQAEDSFLRDHLGRFGPTFFRTLREHALEPAYESLARLGERFLAEELARRGLEPEALGTRRRRLGVEADVLECGAACPLDRG
jgi:TorA maturation chaperone TorD